MRDSTAAPGGPDERLLTWFQGKRVLVTGGNGYLGTRLAALLSGGGCHVARLGRPGARFAPLQSPGLVDNVEGDVRDATLWDRTLAGADVVFHLAAQTSAYAANDDPAADFASNVAPVLHLLETCRLRTWNPIVVFSSTATIAGIPDRLPVDETHPDRPLTIYDLHKRMAEQYLEYYAREGVVRSVSLRLANVYGPGPASGRADRGVLNHMIRRALGGEALTVYGRGNRLRDYVYIDDVVRAFALAPIHAESLRGRLFIVGSGEGHTIAAALNLVAERVAQQTGRRVEVRHVEPPAGRLGIEERDFVADSTRLREATGWQPQYSLAQGIDRTIAAFS